MHDSGELDDGRPYFVMDYADRGTLEDRLGFTPPGRPIDAKTTRTGGPRPHRRAGRAAPGGIVHRDVKPGNLLLQSVHGAPAAQAPATEIRTSLIEAGERVLIGDLGLAKDLVATPLAGDDHRRHPGLPTTRAARAATPPSHRPPTCTRPPRSSGACSTARAHPTTATWRGRSPTSLAPWREIFEQGFAPDPERAVPVHRDVARRAAVRPRHRRSRRRARAADLVVPQRDRCPPVPVQGPGRLRAGGRRLLLRPRGPRRPARAPAATRLRARGRRAVGQRQVVARPRRAHPRGRRRRASRQRGVARRAVHARASARSASSTTSSPRRQQRTTRPRSTRCAPTPRSPGTPRDGRAPLLLCIDQFEELFTLCDDPAEQAAFVEALAAHLDPADSRSRAVLVIRADFYGACARFPWLDPPDHRQPGARRAHGPLRAPARHRAAGAPRRALDRRPGSSRRCSTRPARSRARCRSSHTRWSRRGRGAGTTPSPSTASAPRAASREPSPRARTPSTTTSSTTSSAGPRAGCSSDWSRPARTAPTPDAACRRPSSTATSGADLLRTVIARLTVGAPPHRGRHERRHRPRGADPHLAALSRRGSRRTARTSSSASASAGPRSSGRTRAATPTCCTAAPRSSVATEWAADNRVELNLLEHEFLDAGRGRARCSRLTRPSSRRSGAGGCGGAWWARSPPSPSRRWCRPRSPSPRRAARERASEQANDRFGAALAASGERFVDADPYLAMILAVESGARTRAPTLDARRLLVASRHVAGRRVDRARGQSHRCRRRQDGRHRSQRPVGRDRRAGRRIRHLGPELPPRPRPSSPATPRASSAWSSAPTAPSSPRPRATALVRLWAVRGHDGIPRGGVDARPSSTTTLRMVDGLQPRRHPSRGGHRARDHSPLRRRQPRRRPDAPALATSSSTS